MVVGSINSSSSVSTGGGTKKRMHGPNVSSRIRPGGGGGGGEPVFSSELVRGDQFLGGTKIFVTGLMGEQGCRIYHAKFNVLILVWYKEQIG